MLTRNYLGPSSYRGGFRNQVSRLRASKGNNSSVSGKATGPVSCGKPGFPQPIRGYMSGAFIVLGTAD